jgi:hypothetical protein
LDAALHRIGRTFRPFLRESGVANSRSSPFRDLASGKDLDQFDSWTMPLGFAAPSNPELDALRVAWRADKAGSS